MAAALLRRLPRRPPAFRTLATSASKSPFSSHLPPIPLFSPQNPCCNTNPDTENPHSLLGFLHRDIIPPSFTPPLQIFPSFPYAHHFNPIPLSGFDQSDSNRPAADGQTVWADSVKKKRKKKMNKHKYRKLRKRLNRQT